MHLRLLQSIFALQKEASNLNKLETKFEVENSIISISNILKEYSERCIPPKRKNKNKEKLQIWTEAIIYLVNKGNNKITELRTILQRESPNS
jgi:hypothetical protein